MSVLDAVPRMASRCPCLARRRGAAGLQAVNFPDIKGERPHPRLTQSLSGLQAIIWASCLAQRLQAVVLLTQKMRSPHLARRLALVLLLEAPAWGGVVAQAQSLRRATPPPVGSLHLCLVPAGRSCCWQAQMAQREGPAGVALALHPAAAAGPAHLLPAWRSCGLASAGPPANGHCLQPRRGNGVEGSGWRPHTSG